MPEFLKNIPTFYSKLHEKLNKTSGYLFFIFQS